MLTKKTRYALQALVYLAKVHRENSPVVSSTIAKEKNIPLKFLESILQELCRQGIVKSIRGRNGGYLLADSPQKIQLSKIIHTLSGPIPFLSCSGSLHKPCNNCDLNACGINPVLAEIREAALKILEEKTLYDILDRDFSFQVYNLETRSNITTHYLKGTA